MRHIDDNTPGGCRDAGPRASAVAAIWASAAGVGVGGDPGVIGAGHSAAAAAPATAAIWVSAAAVGIGGERDLDVIGAGKNAAATAAAAGVGGGWPGAAASV